MADIFSPAQLLDLTSRNSAQFWAGVSPRDRRWPDAWAADLGLPEPVCNSATLLAPLSIEGARDLTRRLDDFYDDAEGGDWLLWSFRPTPDLTSLGYVDGGPAPLMLRDPGAASIQIPDGLEIEELTDPDMVAVFWRHFVDWYPWDRLAGVDVGNAFQAGTLGTTHRYWMGFERGQPVSVAMAVTDERLIGVYSVATAPQARGKGYGGAVTDTAARCAPHRPAFLKASDMGFPVYERIGFRKIDQFTVWQRERGYRARHPESGNQTGSGAGT